MTENKKESVFRRAEPHDISKIAQLEKEVWGDDGASETVLAERIAIFKEGNTVLVVDGKIVGYCVVQFVDELCGKIFTWAEITDCGCLKKSHNPNGDFVYGVNLSVHQNYQGKNFGNALIMEGVAKMVRNNKRGLFIGSRIPGYRKFLKLRQDISAENYINLRWKGKLRDPELRLYEEEGFVVKGLLPGYFPDEESLDFGALVFLQNEYYDNSDRINIAEEIVKSATELIRN